MASQEFTVQESASVRSEFTFRLSKFCRRHFIAMTAAVVFAVLAIFFIVFYATKTTGEEEMSTNTCSTFQCLSTAADTLDAMDASANPCNDFYQYACGSWADKFPPNEGDYNSVDKHLQEVNYHRLKLILEDPKEVFEPGSTERKLKNFFRACINDYGRKLNLGKLFVHRVINVSGSSYILQENWNSTSWDFQRALSKAQGDFRAQALFAFVVAPDEDKARPIINVRVRWSSYPPSTNPKFTTVVSAFGKLVRTVGEQLLKDSNTTFTPDMAKSRLDTFVDDVMIVEKFLANMTEHELVEVTLKKYVSTESLTTIMRHEINVTSLLREIFPSPAVIGPDFVVSVRNVKSFRMLGDFLSQLHRQEHFARVMNNYLVWSLMETYLLDLSAPYIDAAREYTIYAEIEGEVQIRSYHQHCLETVLRHMSHAISYMFVRDHFVESNKNQARNLAELAKTGAIKTISGIRNMAPTMRQALINKINETTIKMGYAEWISEKTVIDKHYESLIVGHDHFDNLLNLNLFRRKERALELASDISDEPFSWDVISPYMKIFGSRMLIVPAGLLQLPIYDYLAPMHANQGGLGEHLAEGLFRIIYPVFYDMISQNDSYAADQTLYQAMECFGKQIQNIAIGPFIVGGKRKVVLLPSTFLPKLDLLRHHWGLRAALKVYIDWETTNGKENMTAGLSSFSNHQLFFLKAVQRFCEWQRPEIAHVKANSGIVPRKWIINRVLANLPEFGRTYNCKIGSPMNLATKCDYV